MAWWVELSSAGGRSALAEVLVVGTAVVSEEVVREFEGESPTCTVVYESKCHMTLSYICTLVYNCVYVNIDYHG